MKQPGIYFGLPEDAYHADEALSSSGVCDLLVSPLTFWANSNMNPAREDVDTAAKVNGSATHKMVIEGKNAFADAFAVKPDKADYPGALVTADELKGWLKQRGEKVTGSKPELIERVRLVDQDVEIWSEIMADFEDAADGRVPLAADVYEQIMHRSEIIAADPSVRPAFTGGYPEVSIFWIDEETGVPLRARVDYLKTKALVELKTFSNPFGRQVDAAIAQSVANYRYHVRAAMYMEGVEQAKKMVRERGADAMRKGMAPKEWLKAFAECPLHSFVFVFVEQGLVPNVRVREFKQTNLEGQPTLMWQSGYAAFRSAADTYVECKDQFGTSPWIAPQPMRPFDDEEMPTYLFD